MKFWRGLVLVGLIVVLFVSLLVNHLLWIFGYRVTRKVNTQ